MGDPTRYEDLKELYHARSGASVKERENIDKLMHQIKGQNDPDLIQARQELAGSIRVKDGKSTKKISERIKHMTHRKGIEKRG